MINIFKTSDKIDHHYKHVHIILSRVKTFVKVQKDTVYYCLKKKGKYNSFLHNLFPYEIQPMVNVFHNQQLGVL